MHRETIAGDHVSADRRVQADAFDALDACLARTVGFLNHLAPSTRTTTASSSPPAPPPPPTMANPATAGTAWDDPRDGDPRFDEEVPTP